MCGVDIVGTKTQMAHVDFVVVGRAQLQLQIGAGIDEHGKTAETDANLHSEVVDQPFDLLVEVREVRGPEPIEDGLANLCLVADLRRLGRPGFPDLLETIRRACPPFDRRLRSAEL